MDKILEEFEEILDAANPELDSDVIEHRKQWLSDIIKQALTAQKAELREKIEELGPEDAAYQVALDDVLDIIK